MSGPDELISQWRSEARTFNRRGQAGLATLMESVADDLERCLHEHATEPLSLHEAASECGFTAEGLAKQIKRGDLHNVGRDGAPKIRRCDLPRKPVGGASLEAHPPEPDLAASVLLARDR